MKFVLSIMIVAIFCLPLSSFATDLEAGKTLAQKSCAVCHGIDGQATVPLAAHISGQQKDYLIIQLRAYRSGKRPHDQMGIIAKPLSNEQIDQLAEWYSNIKVTIESSEDADINNKTNNIPKKLNDDKVTAETNTPEIKDKILDMDPEIIQSIQESMQGFIK